MEYVQIVLTEGERQMLCRRFPEKAWTTTPKLTDSGIGRMRKQLGEMEQTVKMNTGTRKHNPALAYDVELLHRVLGRLPDEDQD